MLVDLLLPRKATVYNFAIRHVSASGKRYFNTVGGAPCNVAPYQVAHNSVITALSLINQRTVTGNILLYNGSTLIHTLTMTAQAAKVETGLNISLAQGDQLKAVIGSGVYDYPMLSIDVIWNQ